jgi:Fe-S-cluster-containing hydrogenase component 2
MYYIDNEKCTGCRICVDRCPVGAISVESRKAKIDKNKCTNCGECVNTCPLGAIYSGSDSVHDYSRDKGQMLPNYPFGFGQGMRHGLGVGMGRGIGRGMRRGFRMGRGRSGAGRGYR